MIAPEAESDEALMTRLQLGDDHALTLLMERWQVPMRRYAFRYTRSEATATDLAQEVFVKVYQKREKFATDTCFTAWLFTIATNLCLNHLRFKKRHPTESLDVPEPSQAIRSVMAGDADTPAEMLGRREKIAAVQAAITNLPDELKTVTLLFEYENLSYAEIAIALSCSPKAVETRLYRARQLLRKALGSCLV